MDALQKWFHTKKVLYQFWDAIIKTCLVTKAFSNYLQGCQNLPVAQAFLNDRSSFQNSPTKKAFVSYWWLMSYENTSVTDAEIVNG